MVLIGNSDKSYELYNGRCTIIANASPFVFQLLHIVLVIPFQSLGCVLFHYS